MAKYSDTQTSGRSRLCPYIEGESSSDRHRRRIAVNVAEREQVRTFCEANKLQLSISNNGHHWRIWNSVHVVEWWPSSAKLVIDKHWNRGRHVYDYLAALAIVKRTFTQS